MSYTATLIQDRMLDERKEWQGGWDRTRTEESIRFESSNQIGSQVV
jgi:hypothetical protein